MEECARNCKRREEIAAISFPKKMKIQIDYTFDELNLPSNELLQDHRLSALSPDRNISPVTSSNSGGFPAGDICSGGDSIACCSCSIESSLLHKDSLRVVDLEAKSFETESSTCIDNKFSRETTPSSESYDTDEMDSKAGGRKSCREKLMAKKKIPNQEEIDQFFEEAEKELKKEQKRFADKYNYDIANDVPLEGRYQWVRLKP
ncbi:cyclin-dependent kinase inhibitor 7 [Euphorbia lathyris]|uniref:cyclin-dependent kinase inhibitor 7 n=1 Tax=Euphorbia lathyris TaxID=212925 RepID=UPI003313BEDA